ncbi:MAG: hypothetical protein SNG96_06955 [Rikenellaceae bacterium]
MKRKLMWIALAVCLCNLIPAHAETMESGSIVSKEYYQENQNQSEKRDDVDIMLLGQFGYNTAPQISYGLMFGVTKNHFGFYVKVGSKNCFFTPKFRIRTRNILN